MTQDGRRRGQLAVVLAALAWSTAGPLQRLLDVDSATQVAGRALFAGITLLAYVTFLERTPVLAAFRGMGRAGVGFAVCAAVASGSFIVALNHTTVANVIFVQAASPVVAAALGRVFLKENVASRTWVAMALALGGVGLMMGGPGGGSLLGESLALLMMFSFSIGLVITRARREVSMGPGTFLAQVMLVLVAAPFAHPGTVDGENLLVLALLGVFQIGLGLALLTIGARLISAAEVALITLIEVVVAPIWVWLAFGEVPTAAMVAGGVVVMLAVVVQAVGALRSRPRRTGREQTPRGRDVDVAGRRRLGQADRPG